MPRYENTKYLPGGQITHSARYNMMPYSKCKKNIVNAMIPTVRIGKPPVKGCMEQQKEKRPRSPALVTLFVVANVS